MARGQISDEDLSSGLKGLGGFGALGGAKVIKDSPFRDSRDEHKVVEVAKPNERAVVVKRAPLEAERPAVVEARPVPVKVTPKPVAAKKAPGAADPALQGRRVADIYSERVTLQLSPEMRDKVDALARELQRSKTTKGERITANTVMRVAISHFLADFRVPEGVCVNGEEDLLAAAKRGGKRS